MFNRSKTDRTNMNSTLKLEHIVRYYHQELIYINNNEIQKIS